MTQNPGTLPDGARRRRHPRVGRREVVSFRGEPRSCFVPIHGWVLYCAAVRRDIAVCLKRLKNINGNGAKELVTCLVFDFHLHCNEIICRGIRLSSFIFVVELVGGRCRLSPRGVATHRAEGKNKKKIKIP